MPGTCTPHKQRSCLPNCSLCSVVQVRANERTSGQSSVNLTKCRWRQRPQGHSQPLPSGVALSPSHLFAEQRQRAGCWLKFRVRDTLSSASGTVPRTHEAQGRKCTQSFSRRWVAAAPAWFRGMWSSQEQQQAHHARSESAVPTLAPPRSSCPRIDCVFCGLYERPLAPHRSTPCARHWPLLCISGDKLIASDPVRACDCPWLDTNSIYL